MIGAANGLYRSAYRFFEALRLHENRPKSKKRDGAEVIFGPGGRDTSTSRPLYRCHKDDYLVQDKWGLVHAVSKSGEI